MRALSPLDGRYRAAVEALHPYFSEEALHQARVEVEIRYFMALGDVLPKRDFPSLPLQKKTLLCNIIQTFNDNDAADIKRRETTTNHDVKAVEYWLKDEVSKIKGLKPYREFIHFGLTSEDVNNLAYGLLITRAVKDVFIPAMAKAVSDIKKIASSSAKTTMLSLTHGQPATPTTLGKEMMVFVDRLQRQVDQLKAWTMHGKFGGAVGNYSAHKAAYPDIHWEAFGKKFITSLHLHPLTHTTQINPHDDIAELSHILFRWNTISIGLCRDIWSYISRGIFGQKIIKGEVGSSTMPHKVNPIDFENAEGNFGLANALFAHFAEKLPISRMQRDLSDSTVQRNIGVAFGYVLLALSSQRKGMAKLLLNKKVIQEELDQHPEIHAEALQTVLRKHGVEGAYEKLKSLTRGERVTKGDILQFIGTLKIPQPEKVRLKKMCS